MSTRYIAGTVATVALFVASIAFAQGTNITFPIAELGDCESKEACKAYCDDPAHATQCIDFAEKNGFMSSDEAAQARKFSSQTGPGGCRGQECRAYCADPAHEEECIAFAREHGLQVPPSRAEIEEQIRSRTDFKPQIDEPDIDEEKAMKIVEEQGGPGGCKTKDECRAFCESPENMEQCFAFAQEHGLMSSENIERAKKMMSQEGPGGCRGAACKTYCENPEHAEACLAFAEEQGFIPREEAERARKLMNAVGPGGCRGIECKARCEDPANQNECLEFAIQNDLIPPEEAARVREFMERGGPGGCRSPEECERFCRENPEQCGFRMMGEGDFGGPHNGAFSGPGGCSSPEECQKFCEGNPEACQGFGPGPNQGPDHPVGQERAIEMRGFEIPPGLLEECKKNPEACRQKFQEQGGMGGDAQKFMQMSEEERQKFMQNKQGQMDNFLGRPVYPEQGRGEGKPYQPEGMMPPEAFREPPEGGRMMPMPPERQYQQEFQQRFDTQYQQKYQQQFNQQFDQQYREQYQQYQQSEQFMPPPDGFRPPEGGVTGEYHPPEGGSSMPPPDGGRMMMQPPPDSRGTMPPPDGATFQPPPPPPPSDAPQAAAPRFVASVLSIVATLFGF